MKLNTTLKLGCVAVLMFLLSACAQNKPKKPQYRESFTTYIDESNIKKFTYQITMGQEAQGAQGGRKSKGGRGQGRGDRPKGPPGGERSTNDRGAEREERLRARLDQGLTSTLKESSYCVEGYDVVDEEVRERAAIIRGQCIELATEEDKVRFPNKKAKPLVIEEDLGAM